MNNLLLIEQINLAKDSSYIFFKPYKSNIFRYFIVYLLIICLVFYFFDFNKIEEKSFQSISSQSEKMKGVISFNYVSEVVFNIFNQAQNYKLSIENLTLKNSIIVVVLNSKVKSQIYEFMKNYKDSNIENIEFDKENKRFIANASFKIYRR